LDRDNKWLFTADGGFGYGSPFATLVGSQFVWSLPDVALEITASIKAAHAVLTVMGYLGDATVWVDVERGGATLYEENGTFPAFLYQQLNLAPWLQVIPELPKSQGYVSTMASFNTNFRNRGELVGESVAALLNQILRDLNYGADLKKLRACCQSLAEKIPVK
jgi:hypothetical protein